MLLSSLWPWSFTLRAEHDLLNIGHRLVALSICCSIMSYIHIDRWMLTIVLILWLVIIGVMVTSTTVISSLVDCLSLMLRSLVIPLLIAHHCVHVMLVCGVMRLATASTHHRSTAWESLSASATSAALSRTWSRPAFVLSVAHRTAAIFFTRFRARTSLFKRFRLSGLIRVDLTPSCLWLERQ